MSGASRVDQCARVGVGKHERRQQANHPVGGHVDQQPGVERQLDQLAAGPVELDADHQAHAADVGHARHAGQRIAESGADRLAEAGRALEQPFVGDYASKRRERRRAGERPAAER